MRFKGAYGLLPLLFLAFGCVLALSGSQAFAQSAAVTSLVVNTSNAGVPNVQIIFTNQKIGKALQAKTGSSGTYSLPYVQPGTYTLGATATMRRKTSRSVPRRIWNWMSSFRAAAQPVPA